MSERMTATLVCDALRMALWRHRRPTGVIVHSDRGSQYCSAEHRRLLGEHGLRSSMSQKGDCFDNAAMGSWNHSFKVEAIHGERFGTGEMAKAAVFEYIEIYYNRLSVPAQKSIALLVTQHIVDRLLFFQHITHQRIQECLYISTRRNELGWTWGGLDAPRKGNRQD